MIASRPVFIAGAGIGGLTAAIALGKRGLRTTIFESAEDLEEIGAGIQLSPNASRILIALGLAPRLRPHVVVPQELIVRAAGTGEALARAPLGERAEQCYGAPYWLIHRGDLQRALLDEAVGMPEIELRLGAKVEDFAAHRNGVTVRISHRRQSIEERGGMLVCADGLWSHLRRRLGHRAAPRFARQSAWRALIPLEASPIELRPCAINLWLGHDAHLVHYPVKGGALINVVAIVRDAWKELGWNTPALRRDLLERFKAEKWHGSARELIRASEEWQKWALFDTKPLSHWGKESVTLLGDAAHAMLPALAQGAAMAIEDAAVLSESLECMRNDAVEAARAYEAKRRARTTRVQRAARRNSVVYHLGRVAGLLRRFALQRMGGENLVRHYDWLYGWKP